MTIRLPRRAAPRPCEVPKVEALAVEGGLLPVEVRVNARARRIIMRLKPDASALVVTVPRGVAAPTVEDFVRRHRDWATTRHARAPRPLVVAPDVVLPVRGEPTRLLADPASRSPRLSRAADGMPTLSIGGAPEHFGRRLCDYLKREARRDLQEAVDRHAAVVGLAPRTVTLRDTRSRWGSCTSDRRLSFSWRVVMAPPEVLDYLAAHEVAHFVEMHHGPAFWSLCRRLCPSMEEGRDWLKRHGASLHAVDFRT